jgi:hypothetical protein
VPYFLVQVIWWWRHKELDGISSVKWLLYVFPQTFKDINACRNLKHIGIYEFLMNTFWDLSQMNNWNKNSIYSHISMSLSCGSFLPATPGRSQHLDLIYCRLLFCPSFNKPSLQWLLQEPCQDMEFKSRTSAPMSMCSVIQLFPFYYGPTTSRPTPRSMSRFLAVWIIQGLWFLQ